MRTLYFDCTNGVCGDMIVSGLTALGAEAPPETEQVIMDLAQEILGEVHHHHGHHHEHIHYSDVKKIIKKAPLSEEARKVMERIYGVIAAAESRVHETEIEEVCFHEVGRAAAIANIAKTAAMLEDIRADRILCSPVSDGSGTIECSHGVIPVPVPAVKAMMENCGYEFRTLEVETEMVTPSGLAMLIGMGAASGERPRGALIAKGLGFGSRDTGRGGMEIYLIDEEVAAVGK